MGEVIEKPSAVAADPRGARGAPPRDPTPGCPPGKGKEPSNLCVSIAVETQKGDRKTDVKSSNTLENLIQVLSEPPSPHN